MKRPLFRRKNPKAIDDLLANTVRLAHKKVQVGITDDGEQHNEAGMTVKELAIIHEFGSIKAKIPERSFIRASMNLHRRKYRLMLAKGAPKILIGRASPTSLLNDVGAQAAQDMRQYIRKGSNFEPLAPMTVAKKGHSRPLLDTRQMERAINHKVE